MKIDVLWMPALLLLLVGFPASGTAGESGAADAEAFRNVEVVREGLSTDACGGACVMVFRLQDTVTFLRVENPGTGELLVLRTVPLGSGWTLGRLTRLNATVLHGDGTLPPMLADEGAEVSSSADSGAVVAGIRVFPIYNAAREQEGLLLLHFVRRKGKLIDFYVHKTLF